MIDTHCHLTMLSRELAEVISEAKACGVTRAICIGAVEGTEGAKKSVVIAENFDEVFFSVGVHPHDAGSANLDDILELTPHPKCVAIGETGLDYFREWSPFEEQHKLFEYTLEKASELKKPVVIHCRDAKEDVFKYLKKFSGRVNGVVHCFSEDTEFAKKLWDIGFLISVTGVVTFKKATGLKEVVKNCPIEQLMLETDAPYMAPEPYRGKECEPKHVADICRYIASLREISAEELAQKTTANADKLFNLERS